MSDSSESNIDSVSEQVSNEEYYGIASADLAYIVEVESLLDVPLSDQTSQFARWLSEGKEWINRHKNALRSLISGENARISALPSIKAVRAPTVFQTIMNGISATVNGIVSPLASGAATLLGGLGTGVGQAMRGIFSGVGGSLSSIVGFALLGGFAIVALPRIVNAFHKNGEKSVQSANLIEAS